MTKLFDEIPTISNERVTLSKVTLDDTEGLRELVTDDLVYRYDPTYLFERQYKDPADAIADMYGDIYLNKQSLILGVRLTDEGSFLGLAEFYDYREDLLKVSIGYRLIRRAWGKGIATEVARLMVSYLYTQTNVEIICASTMLENKASARVLEKAGFIHTASGLQEEWGYDLPTDVDRWFN